MKNSTLGFLLVGLLIVITIGYSIYVLGFDATPKKNSSQKIVQTVNDN